MKMSHKLIASKNAQKIMGVVVVVLFLWNTTSADRGQTMSSKMKANAMKKSRSVRVRQNLDFHLIFLYHIFGVLFYRKGLVT